MYIHAHILTFAKFGRGENTMIDFCGYIYTCIHIHAYIHTYILTFAECGRAGNICGYIYTCIRIHAHTYPHLRNAVAREIQYLAFVNTEIHAHTNTCIYIHTHTHMYIHTYILTFAECGRAGNSIFDFVDLGADGGRLVAD